MGLNRRSFLLASSLPAVITGIQGCSISDRQQDSCVTESGKKPFITPDCRLAGMELAELLDRFQCDFFERFTPFFLEHMVDYENGGFFPYTELDGRSRSGSTKRVWWIGRGIWAVSFLYNHLDRHQRFIDIADKAAAILLKNKPSGDDFWPTPLEHSGIPADSQAPSLYEDMFAAEGLAELAEATGDSSLRKLAKETVLKCMRRYDSPEYEYSSTYGLDIQPLAAPRIVGHWMVFLNTSSKMLRYEDDNELRAICDRCIDALFTYHLNPEFDLLNEIIHHDLSRPDNGFEQFSYTSHALETFWMVMWEAERCNNPHMFLKAAHLFKRHVQVSWDDVYGGIFPGVEHVLSNRWQLDKQMWAQVEVLVGCLMLVEHTGDSWAADMFVRMYRYFQVKYSLEEKGCPLWLLGGDRTLATKREGTGGYYHNARWLMLSILMLERMVERDGKVSGLIPDGMLL
jgi:N-acylglucosamine 2-epimerase